MKPFLNQVLLLIVAMGLVVGLIVAFSFGRKETALEQEREKPVKAPTRVEVVNGENVLTLDEAARARSGVALGTLEATSNRHRIRAYGVVVDLSGLAKLRNTIETAKARASKARAALEVAQKDYERVKLLYDMNQIVSQKTLQAAQGTFRAEEANVQTAQAGVAAAQATALQQWGKVIADWLATGAPEIERLWAQEQVLLQVTLSPGQTMADIPKEAFVETGDGQLVAARFVSVALRTDPRIQGQSLFFVATAKNTGLLPGMSVAALLPVGEKLDGVVVPGSAAVWLQGKPWVYVQVEPDKFARREVAIDQPVAEGWFQSKGFSAGQRFVAKGPQVLLSEEFRAQITVGEEGK